MDSQGRSRPHRTVLLVEAVEALVGAADGI